MDYAVFVRTIKTLANIGPILQNLCHWQRTFGQTVRQCLPFQKFHDQVVGAILMANIVQRANIRMIERRDGTGFAVEALLSFGTLRKMVGKDFDRDRAIESRIERTIDFAHTTRTQRGLNLVGPEFRARGQH